MSKETVLLQQILNELHNINSHLDDLKDILSADRQMMWKLLFFVILGAFALVGIKLAIP